MLLRTHSGTGPLRFSSLLLPCLVMSAEAGVMLLGWKTEGGRWVSHHVHFESIANAWQLIRGKSCFRLLVDHYHPLCVLNNLMDVIISSVYSRCQEHPWNRELFRKTYSLRVKLARKKNVIVLLKLALFYK